MYDESQLTCSYWTIDIPSFIKFICGYTSSIVFNISLGVICLTPTWNASCKKITTKYFYQKPGEKIKCDASATEINAYTIKLF